MKKKLLTGILAVAGSVACAAGLSACATHNFSETWSSDGTNHWYACLDENCSEKKDLGEHTYDANGNCTVCDYHKHSPGADWLTDESKHWHECNLEGCTDKKVDEEEHDFNSNGTCTVCGYHVHKFASVWTKSKTEHWHAATCGHTTEVSAKGEHDNKGQDGACSVCGYIEATYSITVLNSDGDPVQGVRVSLGSINATTDSDGLARLTVEKTSYTASLTHSISFTNAADRPDTETYTINKAFEITADVLSYEYTLPTHLPTMELEPLSSNEIKLPVSGEGTYSVMTDYHNASWVSFKNDTDKTKKYTVHFLDANSCYIDPNKVLYADTDYEVTTGDFEIFVRAGETSKEINFSVLAGNGYGYAFTVTEEDFPDGEKQTPIRVAYDKANLYYEAQVSSTTDKYYIFDAESALHYELTTDGEVTVKYLSRDINATGEAVPGYFLGTQHAHLYFKASGEGSIKIARKIIPGEARTTAVEFEQLDTNYTATYTFNELAPNFWFKYDMTEKSVNEKLTLESTGNISYEIYKNNETEYVFGDDYNVQAFEFEAGNTYYILVRYMGEFDNVDQLTAQVKLRAYNSATDDHAPVDGELISDPYEFTANGEPFTVVGRYSSQNRYLKYTAEVNGELVIVNGLASNSFFADGNYDSVSGSTTPYRHYTAVEEQIKTYTIYLKAGETVYYKLSTNTEAQITATFTPVQQVPYVVTVNHASGTPMQGFEVQLLDGQTVVGTQTTGADGKATFNVYPGKYTVKINMTTEQAELYKYSTEATMDYNAEGLGVVAKLYDTKLTYTVTLAAADQSETIDFSGVTKVTLVNGSETHEGTLSGDSWTFENIPAAAYTVQVEGLPSGYKEAPIKTSDIEGSFTLKICKVVEITGGGLYSDKAMQVGMTSIKTSNTSSIYGKFTVKEAGTYHIVVANSDSRYFYNMVYNAQSAAATTSIIFNSQFKPTNKQAQDIYVEDSVVTNGSNQVTEITVTLNADDFLFISGGPTSTGTRYTYVYIEKIA